MKLETPQTEAHGISAQIAQGGAPSILNPSGRSQDMCLQSSSILFEH